MLLNGQIMMSPKLRRASQFTIDIYRQGIYIQAYYYIYTIVHIGLYNRKKENVVISKYENSVFLSFLAGKNDCEVTFVLYNPAKSSVYVQYRPYRAAASALRLLENEESSDVKGQIKKKRSTGNDRIIIEAEWREAQSLLYTIVNNM